LRFNVVGITATIMFVLGTVIERPPKGLYLALYLSLYLSLYYSLSLNYQHQFKDTSWQNVTCYHQAHGEASSISRQIWHHWDDLDLIGSRRGAENRLGLAIHIALLRHPGQGWRDNDQIPPEVIHWLSDQIHVSASALDIYGNRESTRAAHRVLAIEHLGLRPFLRADFRAALELATQAAFGTDEGSIIVRGLLAGLSKAKLVYPGTASLERIGLAGRARARRLAAQNLNDALGADQQAALQDLLIKDPSLGISRLAWLRGMPHSTSVASLHGLLDRLKFVRCLHLPADLGQDIHPARLTKFAREGAVAPAHLLKDFGERRRVATLAAQMAEINIVLTDASIAMFERLTGQLFTRSKRKQDQTLQASQSQIGRLMRLFGGTIDAMSEAFENGEDPFKVLDETVGWDRLMGSRSEVDALGNLATEDPLSLATKRYIQLRRFAPAFLDAFSFTLPDAGADLQAALSLIKEQNRTGKRNLPDVVPMPFAAKHWKALIYKDGKPKRRIYEAAVVATLRDRLRAGDAWVKGSRDYRRFDAYLMPKAEAKSIMGETGLPVDGRIWLKQRRELLTLRLREVERKLKSGQMKGGRIESGRLKITPHDPVGLFSHGEFDSCVKTHTMSYILLHHFESMPTMPATSLTTRIDSDLKTRLERIARFEDRSASYMANQAIKSLVEEREATHELVGVGLQLLETGASISEAAMDSWLQADDNTAFPETDTFER